MAVSRLFGRSFLTFRHAMPEFLNLSRYWPLMPHICFSLLPVIVCFWTCWLATPSLASGVPGLTPKVMAAASDPATRLLENRSRFDAFISRGQAEAAIGTGSELLADTILLHGQDSLQAATWHHNLGVALYQAERFLEALQSFGRALELAEQRLGRNAPELAVTLRHLARVRFNLGEVALAEDYLWRAQHLLHRAYGVYTDAQLPILDDLIRMTLFRQDMDAAGRQQKLYQLIAEQAGEDPAAGHQRLGDWYLSLGRYDAAMEQHRQAISQLQADGRSGLARYASLVSMADILRLQGRCCAKRLLLDALEAVQNDRQADMADLASALLQLADRFQLLRKHEMAGKLYAKANRMLASLQQTGDRFATPRPLGLTSAGDVVTAWRRAAGPVAVVQRLHPDGDSFHPVDSGLLVPDVKQMGRGRPADLIGGPIPICLGEAAALAKGTEDLEDLYVEMSYSVDLEGYVRDVHLLDTNAPPELASFVSNLLVRFRHRPRLVSGAAVATRNLTLRQTFSQRPPATDVAGLDFSYNGQTLYQGCQLLAMQNS